MMQICCEPTFGSIRTNGTGETFRMNIPLKCFAGPAATKGRGVALLLTPDEALSLIKDIAFKLPVLLLKDPKEATESLRKLVKMLETQPKMEPAGSEAPTSMPLG